MSVHLSLGIKNLQKLIINVGTLVEENINDCIESLKTKDIQLANSIIEKDDLIDEKEIEVEEECLKILALHQPVAIDLRYIISVLKINNDLERIGDFAVNISKRVKTIIESEVSEIPDEILHMSKYLSKMLKLSLDALIDKDEKKAREILLLDVEVDKYHSKLFIKSEHQMNENIGSIKYNIQLLTISRYIERAADHCTNIAEDVIYMISGEIVRHHDHQN